MGGDLEIPKLRPIVRPGEWAGLAWWGRPWGRLAFGWLVVAPSAWLLLRLAGATVPAVLVLVVSSLLVGVLLNHAGRHVVDARTPHVDRRPIRGDALRLLADIQQRLDFAFDCAGRLPMTLELASARAEEREVLWRAAELAAEVTALDAEVHDLRYAADGTPQAAHRAQRAGAREATWEAMVAIQATAESFARAAGNAAAAAKVAGEVRGSTPVLAVTDRGRGGIAGLCEELDAAAGAWAASASAH